MYYCICDSDRMCAIPCMVFCAVARSWRSLIIHGLFRRISTDAERLHNRGKNLIKYLFTRHLFHSIGNKVIDPRAFVRREIHASLSNADFPRHSLDATSNLDRIFHRTPVATFKPPKLFAARDFPHGIAKGSLTSSRRGAARRIFIRSATESARETRASS